MHILCTYWNLRSPCIVLSKQVQTGMKFLRRPFRIKVSPNQQQIHASSLERYDCACLCGPTSLNLKDGPENFVFTDEGHLDKHLGVKIRKTDEGFRFSMTQPFLIQFILWAAEIDTRMTNLRPTPVVGPLLSKDTNGLPRKHTRKYCTLTGMLGYLQGTRYFLSGDSIGSTSMRLF